MSNCPRCQIVLPAWSVSNCPILHDGVKLSSVSNCPRCQIVLLAWSVSNCPRCQIVLGVKLSHHPSLVERESWESWERWELRTRKKAESQSCAAPLHPPHHLCLASVSAKNGDGPLHNVHFVKYDGPVVKSWNPKIHFLMGKKYFWGYFSYVVLGRKL